MRKTLTGFLALLLILIPAYGEGPQKRLSRKELENHNAQLEQQNAELLKRIAELEDSLKTPRVDTVFVEVPVKDRPAWLEEFDAPRSASEIDKRVTRFQLESKLESWDPLAYDASFTGKQTDEVYMQRLEAMGSPLNLPYNEVVKNFIVRYSERNRKEMSRILGLCYYYMPMIEQTFDRYGIPLELSALAIIESNLNPRATSKVGAKGMWQFMYNSGRNLGLEIDSFVDERMDVVKSTDAAARYLRDAYRVFGDWALAISAYNCGYGNVKKAIRYAQGKTDYWSIYPYLPTETRYYAPAMVGALYTLHYHNELGIKPAPCALPELTDTMHVQGKMHLKQVTDLVGIELKTLRDLNPQYKHDVIPANGKTYILTIPASDSDAFIEQQDSIALHKADEYMSASVMKSIENSGTGQTIVYKVKSGDNLSVIAAKHKVSVAQLKKWNKLSGTVIRPGQKLIIYK